MYASFLSETRRGTDQERLNSGFKFSQLEMSEQPVFLPRPSTSSNRFPGRGRAMPPTQQIHVRAVPEADQVELVEHTLPVRRR